MANRKTKKLQKKICYTGVGSKKNGNYSLKNFFSLMEKNFKKECSRFLQSKKLNEKCCDRGHAVQRNLV